MMKPEVWIPIALSCIMAIIAIITLARNGKKDTEKEADMGGPFDFLGELSHPDYKGVTEKQYANRMLLQSAMVRHGFRPLDTEWWHFTLENEPWPDTYFTFPVRN